MAERFGGISRIAVDVLMAGSAVMAACSGAKTEEVRESPAPIVPAVAAPRPTTFESRPIEKATVSATATLKETPVTPQAPKPLQATAPSGENRVLELDGNRDALVFKGVGGLENLPLEIRTRIKRNKSSLGNDVVVSKEGEFTLYAASSDCPANGMAFKAGNKEAACGPATEAGKTIDLDVSYSGKMVIFFQFGREVARTNYEAPLNLTQGDLIIGASSVNRLVSLGAFRGQIGRVEILSGSKKVFGTNFELGSFDDIVSGIKGMAIDDAKLVPGQ